MNREADDRRRFAGLDTPVPPPDLRRRTLAAAQAALAREPSPDLWTRLWFSRPLRIAWGIAVALCIAGHVGMTMASSGESLEDSMMFANTLPAGPSDLQEIIDLPWIDHTVLRDAAFTDNRLDDGDQKENAS